MANAAISIERMGSCPTCGLVQIVPTIGPKQRVSCARCGSAMVRRSAVARGNRRSAALAIAALMLYPFAVGLPIVRLEQFGHANETSILAGIGSLLSTGQWFVGIIVLLCSVVFPLGKLVGIFVLAAGGLSLRHEHRALTYNIVELTGKWGMLDVLLVAILVAAVKIGDMVEVAIGPAAIAFAGVVILSLLAAACFDPHTLWNASPQRLERSGRDGTR